MTGPAGADQGRQFERTAFAWLRTALALTAVVLLVVREADADAWAGLVAVAALVVGLGVAVERSEVLSSSRPVHRAEAPVWVAPSLVGAVLGLQLAALVVVL